MKKTLQRALQIFCLFLATAGALAAVLAGCLIAVMVIVRVREGRLLLEDERLLRTAAAWFVSSLVLAVGSYLAGRRLAPKDDESLRLVHSVSSQSEERGQKAFQIAFGMATALLLWSVTPSHASARIPLVLGWLLLGYFGLHLRVFLHELGHLAFAALLRFRLQMLQVGTGYCFGSFRFPNGLRCEWRAWPTSGFLSAIVRDPTNLRAKQSLFIAGGPLVDILIVWASYRAITHGFGGLGAAFGSGPAGLIACLLFWNTALSASSGIIPMTFWIDHRKVWSDGSWLLYLWTASRERIQALALQCDWPQALELLRSSDLEGATSRAAAKLMPSDAVCESVSFPVQRARLSSRLLPARG